MVAVRYHEYPVRCAGHSFQGDMAMNEIKLDPKKLLGFKITGTGEITGAVQSPKIGAKTDAPELVAGNSALPAKAGSRL